METTDDIVGGHNGTGVGNLTYYGEGFVDQAFLLDGNGDYVEVPDALDLKFCPTCPLTNRLVSISDRKQWSYASDRQTRRICM